MIDRKRKEVKNWEDMIITDIKWIGGFRLRYRFANGRIMEYDIEKFVKKHEPKLFKPMLDNPEIIKDVKFDSGSVIYWDDMMDFPSDFLYCVGTIVKEY